MPPKAYWSKNINVFKIQSNSVSSKVPQWVRETDIHLGWYIVSMGEYCCRIASIDTNCSSHSIMSCGSGFSPSLVFFLFNIIIILLELIIIISYKFYFILFFRNRVRHCICLLKKLYHRKKKKHNVLWSRKISQLKY